ncbi:MAG: type I phosphomannose isomerase catalytic subunit [Planctomycetota bacterium]
MNSSKSGSESGSPSTIGPLVFEPILKEKVWGATRLAKYGKRLDAGKLYGESWEIADLATTSTSGGGGGAALSVVADGPHAGKTINELVRTLGRDLLGDARPFENASGPAFPLLIKYLDAGQHLSVQVHPSPAYAAAHPDAHLKTESWVVLEAEPATLPSGETIDPVIYAGINPGVDAPTFAQAARDGTVERLLMKHPARVGDCWTLPSGTCHALGAGVLVAEVQTPSDTTFRVYDWAAEYERSGRELHLEQAVECIDFERAEPIEPRSGEGVVAETEFYAIETIGLERGEERALRADTMSVLMCTSGGGAVLGRGFAKGETVMIAAREAAGVSLRADEPSTLIAVTPG